MAEEFVGIEPAYVRSLLRGLHDAFQQSASFDWVPPLRLSAWVLAQQDSPHGGQDRDRDPREAGSLNTSSPA